MKLIVVAAVLMGVAVLMPGSEANAKGPVGTPSCHGVYTGIAHPATACGGTGCPVSVPYCNNPGIAPSQTLPDCRCQDHVISPL